MDTINVPSKAEYDAMTEENKIFTWNKLQQDLTDLKKIEAAIRKDLIELCFLDEPVGTHNHRVGETEWVLKCKIGETLSLSKDVDAVKGIQEKLPVYLKEQLIDWKPSLSKSVYNTLDPTNKAMIDTVIERKQSAPTLALVIPKK